MAKSPAGFNSNSSNNLNKASKLPSNLNGHNNTILNALDGLSTLGTIAFSGIKHKENDIELNSDEKIYQQVKDDAINVIKESKAIQKEAEEISQKIKRSLC